MPLSKAKYMLSRMLFYAHSDDENQHTPVLLMNHSFVKETARNVDILKSSAMRHFINLCLNENLLRKKTDHHTKTTAIKTK